LSIAIGQGRSERRVDAHDVFQGVSYLQYPLMLVALGYAIKSGFAIAMADAAPGAESFADWNYVLLYAGLGIGLSSLQDPRRVQNEVSRKVWQHPRRGRWMLALLAAYAFGAMAIGLVGAYLSATSVLRELSVGLLAFGLGMLGVLKTAIEMREHHRLDRQPATSTHDGAHA